MKNKILTGFGLTIFLLIVCSLFQKTSAQPSTNGLDWVVKYHFKPVSGSIVTNATLTQGCQNAVYQSTDTCFQFGRTDMVYIVKNYKKQNTLYSVIVDSIQTRDILAFNSNGELFNANLNSASTFVHRDDQLVIYAQKVGSKSISLLRDGYIPGFVSQYQSLYIDSAGISVLLPNIPTNVKVRSFTKYSENEILVSGDFPGPSLGLAPGLVNMFIYNINTYTISSVWNNGLYEVCTSLILPSLDGVSNTEYFPILQSPSSGGVKLMFAKRGENGFKLNAAVLHKLGISDVRVFGDTTYAYVRENLVNSNFLKRYTPTNGWEYVDTSIIPVQNYNSGDFDLFYNPDTKKLHASAGIIDIPTGNVTSNTVADNVYFTELKRLRFINGKVYKDMSVTTSEMTDLGILQDLTIPATPNVSAGSNQFNLGVEDIQFSGISPNLEPNEVVTFYLDNVVVKQFTPTSATWTTTVHKTDFYPGTFTFKVSRTDSLSNESYFANVDVKIVDPTKVTDIDKEFGINFFKDHNTVHISFKEAVLGIKIIGINGQTIYEDNSTNTHYQFNKNGDDVFIITVRTPKGTYTTKRN